MINIVSFFCLSFIMFAQYNYHTAKVRTFSPKFTVNKLIFLCFKEASKSLTQSGCQVRGYGMFNALPRNQFKYLRRNLRRILTQFGSQDQREKYWGHMLFRERPHIRFTVQQTKAHTQVFAQNHGNQTLHYLLSDIMTII